MEIAYSIIKLKYSWMQHKEKIQCRFVLVLDSTLVTYLFIVDCMFYSHVYMRRVKTVKHLYIQGKSRN